MKKNISVLLIALFAFTGINFAQSNAINGVWFISEMHEGGQAFPINMHVVFEKEGIINISGTDAGKWTTNESNNTLTITCPYLNFIEGSNTIETLNDSELKLKNTNGEINSLTKISLPKDKELNNDITGEWMFESFETNGETNSIHVPIDFNKDGIFYMKDRVFGTWDYNQSAKIIMLDTKEGIKGKHSILKHDQKQLVIKGEDGTLSFAKMDGEKIHKENTESGLLGTWKLELSDNPDMLRLYTFKSPDQFALLEKQEGMTGKSSGIWQFSKTDQTLLLVGGEIIRGLNKVISLTEKTLTIENNGVRYAMTKEEDQSNKVERLNFTEADFYDSDGNYKYENDASKLPWQDYYQMMTELSQVKQLVYSFETLMGNSNTFDAKTLTADVSANLEEEKLSIDNIFNGYDRYNLPEDSAMPDNNYDPYISLYPLENDIFRVVGTDEITTPAGTFTCTVVEATGSFGQLIKLWMINDNPGIIAKLVKDTTDGRDDYVVYQLQEIK